MTNRFVISDTHFGHGATWEKFKRPCGEPLRPFSSTEEMDEEMVQRWNSVVKPNDVVYHLGDVVIGKRHLETVKRLNGSKRLIMGNHDIFDNKLYYEAGFTKLVAYRVFVDKYIFSHVPLHPDSITTRFKVNVHGHYHSNEVMWSRAVKGPGVTEIVIEPDPRYLCASVEHTDYTPISFDELDQRIAARWEVSEYSIEEKGWGNGSGPG